MEVVWAGSSCLPACSDQATAAASQLVNMKSCGEGLAGKLSAMRLLRKLQGAGLGALPTSPEQ